MSEPESAGEWWQVEFWVEAFQQWRVWSRDHKSEQDAASEARKHFGGNFKARIIHCRAVVVATLPEPEGG